MAFRVPKSEIPKLATLAELSPGVFDQLEQALGSAHPSLDTGYFVTQIEQASPSLRGSGQDLFDLLIGLHWTLISSDASSEQLAHNVAAAYQKEVTDEQNWTATLEHRLIRLLALDGALGTSAKAMSLSMQHERLFRTATLVSDARPIFARGVDEPPTAYVITHTLTLGIRSNDLDSEFVVALDSEDLGILRDALERADRKDRNLRGQLARLGIPILPEE